MRLLLEAEVVSHAVFPQEYEFGTLSIPDRNIELHLSNHSVELGIDNPLLKALLIFECENLDTGKETGITLLGELLSSLSYVTSFKFQFSRAIRLIDWSEGTFNRSFLVFKDFSGHRLPHFVLNTNLLKTAGILWQASKDHPLETAIHWFASANNADASEDKFQFFWFSLELLATRGKNNKKVNDLCSKCQQPLYCETCGCHPTHRPYAKQAIQQLINEIVGDQGPIISERLFKTRNSLLHGSRKDQIESENNLEFVDCVEDIAHITKHAILKKMKTEMVNFADEEKLEFLIREGYANTTLGLSVDMSSSSIPPDISQLDRLAMPDVSLKFPKTREDDEYNEQ